MADRVSRSASGSIRAYSGKLNGTEGRDGAFVCAQTIVGAMPAALDHRATISVERLKITSLVRLVEPV